LYLLHKALKIERGGGRERGRERERLAAIPKGQATGPVPNRTGTVQTGT